MNPIQVDPDNPKVVYAIQAKLAEKKPSILGCVLWGVILACLVMIVVILVNG